jgi:hypothetical protein
MATEEFGVYLRTLRASLMLEARHAEEIVAEARSHLHHQAADLVRQGWAGSDAAAEAERRFGDPRDLGARLRTPNLKTAPYRLPRVTAGLAVMLAYTLVVTCSGLVDWSSHPGQFIASSAGIDGAGADALLMAIYLLPAALIAGAIAGLRAWWVAASPVALWLGICWIDSLLMGSLQPCGRLREQLLYALFLPLLCGLPLCGAAYLGGRLFASKVLVGAWGWLRAGPAMP